MRSIQNNVPQHTNIYARMNEKKICIWCEAEILSRRRKYAVEKTVRPLPRPQLCSRDKRLEKVWKYEVDTNWKIHCGHSKKRWKRRAQTYYEKKSRWALKASELDRALEQFSGIRNNVLYISQGLFVVLALHRVDHPSRSQLTVISSTRFF